MRQKTLDNNNNNNNKQNNDNNNIIIIKIILYEKQAKSIYLTKTRSFSH